MHDFWLRALGMAVGLATAVPIVLLLLLVVRRLNDLNIQKGKRRTSSFPWRRALVLICLPLLKGLGCSDGWVALGVLVGLSVVFAEAVLRAVLVPLGMVRVVYALSWLAGHPERGASSRLGPAFWAAQALLRRPNEERARFLQRRLSVCAELGPLGAAASALIALSRGEAERALGIFDGLGTLRPGSVSRDVAALAREYRVLEAAGRGNWAQASDFADERPRTRLTRLLSAVASRMRDEPGRASRFQLGIAWLMAPARRATRALLRAAQTPPPAEPAAPNWADLEAQAWLVQRFPNAIRRADVAAAVRSLDALRVSTPWLAELEQRVQALGANHTDAEQVRSHVVASAEADLAEIIIEARLPSAWLPAGSTSTAVRARVREGRVDRLEILAKELHRRARLGHDLPEPDEWIAWGDLSRACAELQRDAASAADHEVLFRIVHRPLWSYGYRQAFQRGQRALGRAAFQLQQELAEAARAFDTYATIDGNLTAARQSWSARLKHLEGTAFCNSLRVRHAQRIVGGFTVAPILLFLGLTIASREQSYSAGFFVAGFVVAAAYVFFVPRRVVEVVETDDGVVLQNESQRYVAQRSDVTVSALSGRLGALGVLRIQLARTPWWLPRNLFSIESNAAAARASAARFLAEPRQAIES